jgi:hypothetical protein
LKDAAPGYLTPGLQASKYFFYDGCSASAVHELQEEASGSLVEVIDLLPVHEFEKFVQDATE